MKELFRTFIELPTNDGIILIVAAVSIVTCIALIVSWISFRCGERAGEDRANERHLRIRTQRRRERDAIQA